MNMYPGTRVLVVDDTEQVRKLVTRLLERHGHVCVAAANAAEAREQLSEETFDLVLCDVKMPGESGFDLAEYILEAHPTTAVLMVTGVDDAESALRALELGAYGYVIKPFSINEILISVVNALRRRTLELDARLHLTEVEEAVDARTRELKDAVDSLHESQEETVRRLSRVAEFRDDQTGEHTQRMAQYCHLLGRKLGLDLELCELLRIASPLHDVGKVAIPDGILLKPGPLTAEERRVMERHAEIGHQMLAGSGQKLLDFAAVLALAHHEHYDGSGYPHGLAGDEIPIEGRIAAVADVFDALTSDRIYRGAFAVQEAVNVLRQRRGTHFDPQVLDAFLDSLDEVLELRRLHTLSVLEVMVA
jgi:putative two-component system response regulator